MSRRIPEKQAYSDFIDLAIVCNRPDLAEFAQHKLSLLEGKEERATARRKEENDDLHFFVQNALTDDWQSIEEITDLLSDFEVPKGKVEHNLNLLCKEGIAERALDLNRETGRNNIKKFRLNRSGKQN